MRNRNRDHSFIDDLIAFEEWMERKEELKTRKKKEEPRKQGQPMSFAEGMVVAFILQFLVGPLYNHYLTVLGVH